MEAQSGKGQHLHHMVPVADVVLLMADDVAHLPLGQGGWQIDFRPHQSQHKGGGDVVGQIDVVSQTQAAHQPAPQPEEREDAVPRHAQHACQPHPGRHSGPVHGGSSLLLRGHRGHRVRGRCLGLHRQLLGLGLELRRLPGLHIGNGAHHRACLPGRGVQGPQQGDAGGQGHRAQQPEEHHRPQGVGKDLGGPLQGQPCRHHAQDHDTRREAHVQKGRKQRLRQECRHLRSPPALINELL